MLDLLCCLSDGRPSGLQNKKLELEWSLGSLLSLKFWPSGSGQAMGDYWFWVPTETKVFSHLLSDSQELPKKTPQSTKEQRIELLKAHVCHQTCEQKLIYFSQLMSAIKSILHSQPRSNRSWLWSHTLTCTHTPTSPGNRLSFFLFEAEGLLPATIGFLVNRSQHVDISVLHRPQKSGVNI